MFTDINFVSYLVVAVVSFVLGAMSKVGYYRLIGRKIVLPFVAQTGRNITALALVVGLVSVVTVFTVSNSANRTAQCNLQYQQALSYNVDLAKEERSLNRQRDDLDSEYQRTLTNSVSELISPDAEPDSAAATLAALVQTTNRIILDKAKINEELRMKEAERKPYPVPTCD